MLLTADPATNIVESLRTLRDGRYQTQTDGVTTWKLGDDLERYAEVIERTKPDVIVETGTRYGGSALWFAALGVDVITVDIKDSTPAGYDTRSSRISRVVDVRGSVDDAVFAQVRALVRGRRAMVSLDSDHHAPHVEREIRLYAPLVTKGCYLVVEDGIFDLAENPKDANNGGHMITQVGGPFRAIERTVAGWPGWARDLATERASSLTHHPAGWWRKL